MNYPIQALLNQAIHAFQLHKIDEARNLLIKVLTLDGNCLPALCISGLIEATQNNHHEAQKLFKKALKLSPNDPTVIYNLAKSLFDCNKASEAIPLLEKVLKLQPNNFDALLNLSQSLASCGRFAEALIQIDTCLNHVANRADVYIMKGAILGDMGKLDEAIASISKGLSLNPNLPDGFYNLGIILSRQMKSDDSINAFRKAIELNPNYFQAWNNLGLELKKLNRADDAIHAFSKSLEIAPSHIESLINLSTTFLEQNNTQEALNVINQVFLFQPENAINLNNKGICLGKLGRPIDSLDCHVKAHKLSPSNVDLTYNYGNALANLKKFPDAIAAYQDAFKIDPKYPLLIGNLFFSKLQICDWSNYETLKTTILTGVQNNLPVIYPFSLLSITDSEDLHLKAAKSFSEKYFPERPISLPIKHKQENRIRIGYFSADFHNHATAHLIIRLFELHNRDQFEIYAFSFGPNISDEYRIRLEKAFDHFFEVSSLSDTRIREMAKNCELDIAVDLKGFTENARTGIFAEKCAPIQISYLGYPGSMGAPYIDYIIADRIVIPEVNIDNYLESIVYLPNCYQVNDELEAESPRPTSKRDFGLPESGFIFCCLNNNYKITPDVFNTWMNILNAVENSVLWLYENSPAASKNLRLAARNRGVNEERLIFAAHLPRQAHLERHRHADLFLDTFPYNAHTTASDSLRAGVPVLTLQGNSFASRVASSLLNQLSLNELVTKNLRDYEKLAIQLAISRDPLEGIKLKLISNLQTSLLFNPQKFTEGLESIYLNLINKQ